jgi:hypothetical protein
VTYDEQTKEDEPERGYPPELILHVDSVSHEHAWISTSPNASALDDPNHHLSKAYFSFRQW